MIIDGKLKGRIVTIIPVILKFSYSNKTYYYETYINLAKKSDRKVLATFAEQTYKQGEFMIIAWYTKNEYQTYRISVNRNNWKKIHDYVSRTKVPKFSKDDFNTKVAELRNDFKTQEELHRFLKKMVK